MGMLQLHTLALHPLIGKTIKNGTTLVTDCGAGLVVMLNPCMWGAGLEHETINNRMINRII